MYILLITYKFNGLFTPIRPMQYVSQIRDEGKPSGRQAFSLCPSNQDSTDLVIFGGVTGTHRYLSELYSLDVVAAQWTRHDPPEEPGDCPAENIPCARALHSMTRIGQHLYVLFILQGWVGRVGVFVWVWVWVFVCFGDEGGQGLTGCVQWSF